MAEYRTIRQALEQQFATNDLVIGHWNVTVTAKADGTSILHRKRHMSEGSTIGISMEITDADHPEDDARRFAAVVARLMRRDAALTSVRASLSKPPQWAHIADKSIVDLVRRLDGRGQCMCEWRLSNNRTRGWNTSLQRASFANSKVLGTSSFALRTRAHIEEMSYDGLMWISDTTGVPIVTVAKTIPATIAIAAEGRPLDAIIDHPMINGLGAVIRDIEQRDHLAIVRLEPRLTTLEKPPTGVDVSWLMPAADEPFEK